MRNRCMTLGLLGFLAFVFCVDTAISDAQLLRGRRCPSTCQICQPECQPDCFQCPPGCYPVWRQDACGRWYRECECRTTAVCSGNCTISYNTDTGMWEINTPCTNAHECYCEVPVVSGTTPGSPQPCQSGPAVGNKSFRIRLGTENTSTQQCFFFNIPASESSTDFVMHPVKVDLGGGQFWTIGIDYDSSYNIPVPKVKPDRIFLPDPPPSDTQVSLDYAGGTFTNIKQYDFGAYNTREYWFKDFKVTVTRDF